jgi:hypothetical protein
MIVEVFGWIFIAILFFGCFLVFFDWFSAKVVESGFINSDPTKVIPLFKTDDLLKMHTEIYEELKRRKVISRGIDL